MENYKVSEVDLNSGFWYLTSGLHTIPLSLKSMCLQFVNGCLWWTLLTV